MQCVPVFTVGNDLPTNAQAVFLCSCAANEDKYSTKVQNRQERRPEAFGAAYIPTAETEGLTPRCDKEGEHLVRPPKID
jgi:hypothetical protein